MRNVPSKKIGALHKNILSWYRKHRRTLSWRSATNPYEILVSEVMLQQTQVSRVQEKFPKFLSEFPSIASLSNAATHEVIRAWRGMGYNSRAIRLRDLARAVESDFGGHLPNSVEGLLSLPGVGPYTAHAVACFAWRKRVPVVDVNIRRVLSRVLWKMRTFSEKRPEREIWEIAGALLPRNAYLWNQALMDLGATICTARKPLCDACPVASHCASRKLQVSMREPAASSKRPEPMYDGIPRRIWRGRIVQRLRLLESGKSISLLALGRSIRRNFRGEETPWLVSVVERLRLDGLVAVRQTPRSLRISLASE